MLVDLYPKVHRRYSSLAIIGPILDGYGTWLLKQGYSTERACAHFRAAPRLVRGLGFSEEVEHRFRRKLNTDFGKLNIHFGHRERLSVA